MSDKRIGIPVPRLAPFGIEVDSTGVMDVWNTFVKPDQDNDVPQSVEMRALMAILRAVYQGMTEDEDGATASNPEG